MIKRFSYIPNYKTIVHFLSETFEREQVETAVIGISGGIDSSLSLKLLSLSLDKNRIYPFFLPYFSHVDFDLSVFLSFTDIPIENFKKIDIQPVVDAAGQILKTKDKVRLGNLMARCRMLMLFDQAKKLQALVCGTENKTEKMLGYFTRFGDAAADIEPISHLYKTEVRLLASELGLPQSIIDQPPSANLWPGQTDEADFGFAYDEADQVLYLHFEKRVGVSELKKQGFPNAAKIIARVKANQFKNKTPYHIN